MFLIVIAALSCGQQSVEQLWQEANAEKNPDRRIEILSKAIELEPNNPGAYFKRGELHAEYVMMVKDAIAQGARDDDNLDDEHYDAALRDLTRAIELDPAFSKALWWRGNAQSYMHHMVEACKDWHSAIALGFDATLEKSLCP